MSSHNAIFASRSGTSPIQKLPTGPGFHNRPSEQAPRVEKVSPHQAPHTKASLNRLILPSAGESRNIILLQPARRSAAAMIRHLQALLVKSASDSCGRQQEIRGPMPDDK